jgi:HEPN domain-containing protein
MPEFDAVQEWLQFAEDDLFTARHMFYDVYPKKVNIVSWHCQQCAEKSLKAFIISHNLEFSHIHDLAALCLNCMEYDASFAEILTLCKSLNPYGVVTRYPNELEIDDTIAENNITRANTVYTFCRSKSSGKKCDADAEVEKTAHQGSDE